MDAKTAAETGWDELAEAVERVQDALRETITGLAFAAARVGTEIAVLKAELEAERQGRQGEPIGYLTNDGRAYAAEDVQVIRMEPGHPAPDDPVALAARLAADQALYGFAAMTLDGRRVDPTTVRLVRPCPATGCWKPAGHEGGC